MNSPKPTDSEQLDAQAEVGLRNQLLTLKDRDGQYVVGSLLAEDPMRLHALIDFIQADKAAAVAEAEVSGGIKSLQELWQNVPMDAEHIATVRDISDLMVFKLQARLQPPTAGEVQNNGK